MTWRLDTISITNFKAFKNEQTIELNGKNYLLYGDNGSGKSSIFWSLYTLYQSCYKKEETKVRKYFDVTNDENLLNRYVSNPDSSIVATFMDVDNAANIKEIKMSNNDLSIVGTTDTFTIATVTFSDFFNYQKQSSLFDYCNSEDNDAFKPFLRDLFPFIKLRNKMVKIDGNEVDSDSAFEAWTYLVDAVDKELKHDDGSLIYEEDDKYKKYQEALYQFNEDFKIAIVGIEGNVGRLLHSKMELPNVNLLFEYKEATFNDTINGNGLKDGKLHAGKILISAEDTNIADANKRKIKHPRTYFNEATLSKIALAIRLAVFENKASFYDSDGAKLLFVDDLLVTFDMRNRIDVMNILLGYAESYQLLIFTHDRAFYNMFKNHLLDMEQHKKWKFAQIYMQGNGHQVPKIVEEKSNLDMAKKYFDENDCVASAVYLRKECEKIAKLSNLLKKEHNIIIAASDTFRAAAIEQLEEWANRLSVSIVKGQQAGDPASVLFSALDKAKSINADIVIVDTAGRFHNQDNLIRQLEKMKKISTERFSEFNFIPILVLDANVGHNGIEQAKVFTDSLNIEGAIVSKMDSSAKGGVAISVAYYLSLPIFYLGYGEKVDDFKEFDIENFVDSILK